VTGGNAGAGRQDHPARPTHLWRSADYDFPCDLTGREERHENGVIYVWVTVNGTEHVVPKHEVVARPLTPEEYRLLLLAAGYEPLPAVGKAPMLRGYTSLAIDAAEIRSWSSRFRHARNTGVLTRNCPTLDIDVLDEAAAEAVERLTRDRFEERGELSTRFGNPPKRALLFRTDEPFLKITRRLATGDDPGGDIRKQRLEFCAAGQQVIVAGVHPDTQRPYAWHGRAPGELRREDLPEITAAEARQLIEDATTLLVEQFGYRLPIAASGNSGAGGPEDKSWTRDWPRLLADLHDGRNVHDSCFGLAVRLIRSGSTEEDAIDIIRGAIDASSIERESPAGRARFQQRRHNVANIVRWARQHFEGPAESIDLGNAPWPKEEELDAGAAAGAAAQPPESEPEDTSPLALYPPLAPQRPYPTHALGALAEGAAAVARQTQAAPSIAGNAVLAVACLVGQALADVVMPIGRGKARPLSLYFVTVAESGDRKTSADDEALRPVRQHERELKTIYEGDLASWRVEHRAWTGHVRSLDGKRNLPLAERARLIKEAGDEPRAPLHPALTTPDLTIQGLARKWLTLPAALGLFSSEGGQMTGGYGFSPDQRLATASELSRLWESGTLQRLRVTDDALVDLHGRRLAVHLMIQPDVALPFLGDRLLRNQGFLSRLLVGAPPSLAGSRMIEEAEADDLEIEAVLARYSALITKVLDAWPKRLDEVKPRRLALDPEARALWAQFHNHVESEQGAGRSLAEAREIANKIAEQALRIAGVLTIAADSQASFIGLDRMSNGVELATWYLDEAVRLGAPAQVDPSLQRARLMLEWLHRSGRKEISTREALQFGPGRLRQKALIEAAFKVLAAHFWLKPHPAKRRRWLVAKGDLS
jgi:hypothetical protein